VLFVLWNYGALAGMGRRWLWCNVLAVHRAAWVFQKLRPAIWCPLDQNFRASEICFKMIASKFREYHKIQQIL
jgi:hypothetical protein